MMSGYMWDFPTVGYSNLVNFHNGNETILRYSRNAIYQAGWGVPAKPQLTGRLLKMIAAVHGQLWNATQLGQSLGISQPKVNDYVNFLEGAFLIRRLLPYQSNLRKRLTKKTSILLA